MAEPPQVIPEMEFPTSAEEMIRVRDLFEVNKVAHILQRKPQGAKELQYVSKYLLRLDHLKPSLLAIGTASLKKLLPTFGVLLVKKGD